MSDPITALRARLLPQILANVPFDGWSDAALSRAASACGLKNDDVRLAFPGGGLDALYAWRATVDAAMLAGLAARDLSTLRFRDRIALALRLRLQDADPEVIRRALAVTSLPQNMAREAQAVWHSCDLIWRALGDRSTDYNYYTKRAMLAAVYAALVLYWLNDNSEGHADSWAFLDREIDQVMRIEQVKAKLHDTPLGRLLLAPLGLIRAPQAGAMSPNSTPDMPFGRPGAATVT